MRLSHSFSVKPSKQRARFERSRLGHVPVGIGHNKGPRWSTKWERFCWTKAYLEAWKLPDRDIVLRILARAEALGLTYRAYVLELKERGVYL